MNQTMPNKNRQMYILLIDISDSAPISESQLQGEIWNQTRSEFAGIMTKIIESAPKCYRDYSKCFGGDAAKVFFLNIEAAITTAQKMLSSWMSSRCNRQLKYEGKPLVVASCAIHWGVFSITTGQPEGYNFNLTNRVQKMASERGKKNNKCVILITKEAFDRLPADSKIRRRKQFNPLGQLEIKNLKKIVEAWEVLECSRTN